jgi:hypothetical protein
MQIVEAAIVPISDVQASNPNLEVHIDPKDFTRLRSGYTNKDTLPELGQRHIGF